MRTFAIAIVLIFLVIWLLFCHSPFGKNKIIFDTTMTIVAAVMAIIMFHSIQGVREGTIIAAVLVGATAKFCKKNFSSMECILK